LPLLSGKLALIVACLLNLYKILFLLSYKVIDAVSNRVIIPITNPYSIAVSVSTSNTNILRSSFLISLNRFSLKSLFKYYSANTTLKVTIRSLLHL